MSLVILTKPPRGYRNIRYYISFFKKVIRFVLGQKRGPNYVTQSILDGLTKIKYNFKLNPSIKDITKEDTIYINESIEALKYIINKNKDVNFKKIVVGPNIIVLPREENSVIENKAIDVIIQPSAWTKDLWCKMSSNICSKIQIWPAGIDLDKYDLDQKQKDRYLIYYKNTDKKILHYIKKYFAQNNIKYSIIKYGKYSNNKYLKLLDKSKGMIFLSNSESQGIALLESWAKDVPTLVYDKKVWEYKKYKHEDDKISAPYLTKENGMYFYSIDDFEEKFNLFSKAKFQPRENILDNHTLEKATNNFLNIVNS